MFGEKLTDLLTQAKGELTLLEGLEKLFEASQEEGTLYWEWGQLWRQLAVESGEAHDLKRAIDKFERAKGLGVDESQFWVDYGEAVGQLAQLVRDERLVKHALELYGHAVEGAVEHALVWVMYGRACLSAYELTGEERYLQESDRSFGQAVELEPGAVEVWLDWAHVLRLIAHTEGREEELEEALMKAREGQALDPASADCVDLVVQILVELGVMGDDRLDLLRWARTEIEEAVVQHPLESGLWCRYGEVLEAFAAYFGEERELDAALQKFRRALALQSDSIDAHLGLATTSYGLGMVRNEFAMLERAATHCAAVVKLDEGHATAFVQWAQALLRMAEMSGDPAHAEGARDKFERALIALPGEPQAGLLAGYGASLDMVGVQSEDEEILVQSVRILAKAVDLDGDEAGIRFHLAQSMGHLAELTADPQIYEQAAEQLYQLAQRDPDDEVIWDEWGCLLVGLAHLIDDPVHSLEAAKLREEAEEKLKRAISLGSSEASYHLAWLCAHKGEMESAIHWLERARERGTLPGRDDLLDDEWLKNLHDYDAFQALLRSL